MTRHEELRQQYEDVLFSLILEEVAESEGEEALEEITSSENGSIVIPPLLEKRCRKIIEKDAFHRQCRTFGRGFSRVIGKIAAVALVAMLLFTTAFASSEEFRQKTLNLIMEAFEDYTEVSATADQFFNEQTPVPSITVGWIPTGFKLYETVGSEMGVCFYYKDEDSDAELMVGVYNLFYGSAWIDTEQAQTRKVQIRDAEAIIAESEGATQILWQMEKNSSWVGIGYEKGVSAEELIKVVEALIVE